MANLVEAHAASVKPSVGTATLATASVAEQALADAEQAKAAGDEEKAAKAEALAAAMTQAEPVSVEPEVIDDQFLEIAQDLERGTWIEFEADDGQLAFAKLAWISFAARHLPVHEPAGPEGVVDECRGACRAVPHRSGAPGRGRAAHRPRLRQHDGVVRRDAVAPDQLTPARSSQVVPARTPHRDRFRSRRVPTPHRRAHHRRRDSVGQAPGPSPRPCHRDACRARTRARLGALRRRRSRCARRRPPRFVRAAAISCLRFGGVGATPDDHTRQAAALALGVPLERHPVAVAELEAQFGAAAYPHRVLMAEFPAGASIIPNPVNRVASFSIRNHYFFPGFPQMAWPMLDWVLATRDPPLDSPASGERAIVVHGAGRVSSFR